MRQTVIILAAIVACATVASATPVETGEFEGRKISANSKNNWGGVQTTHKKSDKYFSSSDEFYHKQQQNVETSAEKDRIYMYKNGELEHSNSDVLSQVMDSNLYRKEVVYRQPNNKKPLRRTDITGGSKSSMDLLQLLPFDKSGENPQKVVIYQKIDPLMKMINGLYEIIIDIFYIVSYNSMSVFSPQEKSDNGIGHNDRMWPMLKNVFIKYFKLIRETDLLNDLEEVLPIDEMEQAMEKNDGDEVWMILYNSFTPEFFSYAVRMMSETFSAPHMYGVESLIPKVSDMIVMTKSVGGIVENLLNMVQLVVGSISSYSNDVGRSLRSLFVSPTNVMDYDYDSSDLSKNARSSSSIASNSFGIVAGLGGAAIASYMLLNSWSGNENIESSDPLSRQRRDTVANSAMPPIDINSIVDSIQNTDYLDLEDHPLMTTDQSTDEKMNFIKGTLKTILMKKLTDLLGLTHPIISA